MRQNTVGDYVGRSFAIFGLATPNFWLATISLVFPAIWWGWSPPLRLVRLSDDFARHFAIFIVPGLILGTYLAASTMRMTRTMMLEVLRQDYTPFHFIDLAADHRVSAQERSRGKRRAIDRDALHGCPEQVTEMGTVAGNEGTAVERDRRGQHRLVLVVDWQTFRILIAAMGREDLDRFGQCIESGKR